MAVSARLVDMMKVSRLLADTMPPDQLLKTSFRESHCCCEMELMVVSILESARKPPLAKLPSVWLARSTLPCTCMRRKEVPCETAQMV